MGKCGTYEPQSDDRIPARFSEALREGIVGAPLLRPGDRRLSDLELLVLPALRLFGLEAGLTLAADSATLFRGSLRRGRPAAVFGLAGLPSSPAIDDENDASPGFTDPLIVHHAVATIDGARSAMRTLWLRRPGSEPVEEPPEADAWALVTIRKLRPASRAFDHITAVLMRCAAFAAANPERVLTAHDTAQIEAIPAFLTECCGRSRAPWAIRLRRAASAFSAGAIDSALGYVKEAALLRLGLAPGAHSALLNGGPPSSTAKRELVYLARAGTDELKALAGERLLGVAGSQDVQLTLQQFAHSPNAWLRSIARMTAE